MSLPPALASWQARWDGLADSERQMLTLVAVLLLAAILWLQVLAPARATLRNADAQAQALDAQLQQMQKLQAQAQALQHQPALGLDAALQALGSATQQTLGATAQLTHTTEHASVTLKAVSADALAQWLVQARLNARSVPLEAQLTRTTTAGVTSWSGVLLMSLPARQSP